MPNMASDIDNALFVAWDRVLPLLKADPRELQRRLMRRRQPMLTRPPRAYCIAVRASDTRINAWSAACVPESHAKLTDGRFADPGPHEVTLDKKLLVDITQGVDLSFWRAHDLTAAANKLGVSTDALHHQRKKGVFRIDYLQERNHKAVPYLMRDDFADPCGRNGHKQADPEWNWVWTWLAETLPDDFEQTLERVPCTRPFRGKECFRGWRWICPKCGEKVSSVFLPKRIMTVSLFNGDEKDLITSGDDEVRPYEPTFACTKCHRIRYWSSLHHNSWNQLIAYLSGGLLYGTEVEKPEWFTPRRRRAYARHKSEMARGKQVERYLNEGLSYMEIAERMSLTLSGVQGHVKRVYKRRGVRSRKALKALATA
jgi:DNA-binding CsgD family transcriptional regulator